MQQLNLFIFQPIFTEETPQKKKPKYLTPHWLKYRAPTNIFSASYDQPRKTSIFDITMGHLPTEESYRNYRKNPPHNIIVYLRTSNKISNSLKS